VSQEPFLFFSFERQKDRIPRPVFCQIQNWVGEIITTANMVEW